MALIGSAQREDTSPGEITDVAPDPLPYRAFVAPLACYID